MASESHSIDVLAKLFSWKNELNFMIFKGIRITVGVRLILA